MIADVAGFMFGVSTGAALAALWLRHQFREYVLNCRKVICPHHGPRNVKRINDNNDRTRNGPTRPDLR